MGASSFLALPHHASVTVWWRPGSVLLWVEAWFGGPKTFQYQVEAARPARPRGVGLPLRRSRPHREQACSTGTIVAWRTKSTRWS